MRTLASIFKHPIHPMLIIFPIGLWIFSLACDLIRPAGASADAWSIVAFFSMIGGLIGALCAAVPGFIDLLNPLRVGLARRPNGACLRCRRRGTRIMRKGW
jgi:uncharacterized membrane protein